MAVVKIELDRERALRETVRVENFLKRTPPDITEALRELEAPDGLEQLLKNAPLVGEPPPVEEPPVEPPPTGFKLVYKDNFAGGSATPPFVVGGNSGGSMTFSGGVCICKTPSTGERQEISLYKAAANSRAYFVEGDHVLVEWTSKLPAGFGYSSASGAHNTVGQFKGLDSGEGSPNLELQVRDLGSGVKGLFLVTRYTGSEVRTLFIPDAQLMGATISYSLEVVVSRTGRGSYVLKGGGHELKASNVNTLQTISEHGFFKLGLYGGTATAARENDLSNVRVSLA